MTEVTFTAGVTREGAESPMQQSESHSKLYGFVMMFLSSSLMGGIGAFARYIEAPGLFISFCRNGAGLILMTLIFLAGRKYVKFKGFKVTPLAPPVFKMGCEEL